MQIKFKCKKFRST